MPGPVISGIASLIVPGLGQLLNRKYKRGIILLVGLGAIVFIGLPVLAMIGGIAIYMIVHLIYAIAIAFDAYKIGKGATGTW